MLSEINQCVLNIALVNPYYYKSQGVPLKISQKLYIMTSINRGIIYFSLLHSIGLFAILKILRKPKYWARNKFFTLYPQTQGILLFLWGLSRIYQEQCISILFQEQIDCVIKNQVLQQPSFYNKMYVRNKLENIQHISNIKQKKNQTNILRLHVYNQEDDQYKIRKINPPQFQSELFDQISKHLNSL